MSFELTASQTCLLKGARSRPGFFARRGSIRSLLYFPFLLAARVTVSVFSGSMGYMGQGGACSSR